MSDHALDHGQAENKWVPDTTELEELVKLLVQAQTQKAEITFPATSSDGNYLAYVLCYSLEEESVRILAGHLLIHHINTHVFNQVYLSFSEVYIKQACLSAIGDPSASVRAIVASIICVIANKFSLLNWQDLVPLLCQLIDSKEDQILSESALRILFKICKDYTENIDVNLLNSPMIPKFFTFFHHKNPEIRSHAINSVAILTSNVQHVMTNNLEVFVKKLCQLLQEEEDIEVLKTICLAIEQLIILKCDFILPNLSDLINSMLDVLETHIHMESVTVKVHEVFYSLIEFVNICKIYLEPFLERLIPNLLKTMRYSPAEIELFKSSESLSSEWNLRKISANILDVLSSAVFNESLSSVLVPLLKEALDSTDWLTKEAGILALGATVESCCNDNELLFIVIPELINVSLSDDEPLIRSISCWTLSRYHAWINSQPQDIYCKPLIIQLLKNILDYNAKVQESACCSFSVILTETQFDIVPFINDILQVMSTALLQYEAKSFPFLYAAIAESFDDGPSALKNQENIDLLILVPLLNRWSPLKEKTSVTLLECVTSIVTVIKKRALPYSEEIFANCVRDITEYQGSELENDKNLISSALYLLSVLIEALSGTIEPLITKNSDVIMKLLFQFMQSPLLNVRQSSFALLGDLTKVCFQYVRPYLDEVMEILCRNLDPNNPPESFKVVNNSVWSIGEIVIQDDVSHITAKYFTGIMLQLIYLINVRNHFDAYAILIENVAVTLGRLGTSFPFELSSYLPQFVKPWCDIMKNNQECDSHEVESAFKGICASIASNPLSVSSADLDLEWFCTTIEGWESPGKELTQLFCKVLSVLTKDEEM